MYFSHDTLHTSAAYLHNKFMLKNYHFKHICNDDNDIGRRKQQRLAYHIFTCEFPVSYITLSQHCKDEIRNLHVRQLKQEN